MGVAGYLTDSGNLLCICIFIDMHIIFGFAYITIHISVINSILLLFCSIANQVQNKQPGALLQKIPEKLNVLSEISLKWPCVLNSTDSELQCFCNMASEVCSCKYTSK